MAVAVPKGSVSDAMHGFDSRALEQLDLLFFLSPTPTPDAPSTQLPHSTFSVVLPESGRPCQSLGFAPFKPP
ncbi:hypothetical protein HBH55_043150 [Parastagonospora nodorum]|nr:hypothetical protein HBH54_080810 [Parastagonospora nodorum]KAH4579508.1 hypothetical protein HBH84_057240 [Parastagonospora nodorum]KAH4638109.1 hypothetical protein HBH55_043150 [Parastagonospora nodorum]KAH4647438.1 hypothetical protein HBH81_021840 [Parastagonospora nodorum]